MDILESTAQYEAWLGRQMTLLPQDVELKHRRMAEGDFPFLRATYYRWVQRWPEVCPELAAAPAVLGVGDLHIENFGTWRDAEGRLIWGINDFDEAWTLAYTNDLVRLAASGLLAIGEQSLAVKPADACDAILEGYGRRLAKGGCPFVLSERQLWLRDIAVERLKDPRVFWNKLEGMATLTDPIPPDAQSALEQLLPEKGLAYRVVHRIAGLGSLGRPRYVALAEFRGGLIAREAKALAASACVWQRPAGEPAEILYQKIIDRAVREPDPWVRLCGEWIVRRLAPDCSRVELGDLPKRPEEWKLLRAMGAETANVHLADRALQPVILEDLQRRKPGWLAAAAQAMVAAVQDDWKAWRKANRRARGAEAVVVVGKG